MQVWVFPAQWINRGPTRYHDKAVLWNRYKGGVGGTKRSAVGVGGQETERWVGCSCVSLPLISFENVTMPRRGKDKDKDKDKTT